MVAEHGLRDEVVDKLLGAVLDHGDLLQDDLALGVEVGEGRCEDHVGHHVERLLDVVVEDPSIDDRVVARGRGVELAAEGVEDLGDLLGRVGPGTLEEEVLEEMGHPCAAVVLVARARSDPQADRRGANAGERLADHPRAAVELRQQVVLHKRMVSQAPRKARPGSPEPRTSSLTSFSGGRASPPTPPTSTTSPRTIRSTAPQTMRVLASANVLLGKRSSATLTPQEAHR